MYQTGELLTALLSGRPFVIGVEALSRLSSSKRPRDVAAARVLEAVHATAMQLARQGLMPAPVFMTNAREGLSDGWEVHADGSSIHRGNLLSTLLPGRATEIAALRAPHIDAIDADKPLRRLAA